MTTNQTQTTSRLRRLRNTAVAVLAITGVLAVPSLASAHHVSPSQLTISSDDGIGVSGFILNKDTNHCSNDRTVTVFKLKHGQAVKVGSDNAQPNGDGLQYFVHTMKHGKFFAKVKATSHCGGATSKVITR